MIDATHAEIFRSFIAAEYAYLTPKGEPLCWPVTPYWQSSGVHAIATGLAYPNKADYAKRNPKVALVYSDPNGSGLDHPPVIQVKGEAAVLDDDIQENTDRYVKELRQRFAVARMALNNFTARFLDFYLPRLWVEITPTSITEQAGIEAPPRSPASIAGALAQEESAALERAVRTFGDAVVTTVDNEGFPSPSREIVAFEDGAVIFGGDERRGPACLTFHRHSLGGTRFEAHMARGSADGNTFVPRRLVGFFGNGVVFPLSVLPDVGRLRRRLREELAKRGKEMPKLRVPA